jgi:hypothetical protein
MQEIAACKPHREVARAYALSHSVEQQHNWVFEKSWGVCTVPAAAHSIARYTCHWHVHGMYMTNSCVEGSTVGIDNVSTLLHHVNTRQVLVHRLVRRVHAYPKRYKTRTQGAQTCKQLHTIHQMPAKPLPHMCTHHAIPPYLHMNMDCIVAYWRR